MAYFVVINEQGSAWVPSRGMREQEKWTEHAEFVNALVREGFVVAAGPIGDGSIHRALLIVHSDGEEEIRTRFAADPWMRAGILHILKIDPWNILASDDRLDRTLAEITQGES